MPELPTGTVTFLFSDIEGSTKLWERYPTMMRTALARHDCILRQSIEANGGSVFKTVGDAFYAAFPIALSAMVAAVKAQRLLQAESWGETGPLKVRIALHTGTAEERGGDYFGSSLNRYLIPWRHQLDRGIYPRRSKVNIRRKTKWKERMKERTRVC